jgi:hypothetical protein
MLHAVYSLISVVYSRYHCIPCGFDCVTFDEQNCNNSLHEKYAIKKFHSSSAWRLLSRLHHLCKLMYYDAYEARNMMIYAF